MLANSSRMRDIACGMGAHETRLIGTPVARQFLDHPVVPLATELRRVLFAGRLAPEKNISAVVEAAESLPGLQFSIAGDGPLRDEIETRAGEIPNLNWLGWLSPSRMLATLDEHDLLVLPSYVESFGTVALEAMARNRNVLVSGQCGILDWPELGRGLFYIQDHETLSDAIHRISALDPALRRKKAQLARAAAHRLNDWNLRLWLSVLCFDRDCAGGG